MSKCFNLTSNDVSGLLNFALSLNTGASLLTFRQCLAEVVAERLELVFGRIPQEVLDHQSFILDVFGQTGTKQAERRHILQGLGLGDWRNTSSIEVYITPGTGCNRSDIVKTVVQGLSYALCHTQFSLYPRHRWLGADAALDQIALLQAVFGLATAVCDKFLIASGDKVASKPEQQMQAACLPEDMPAEPSLPQASAGAEPPPVLDTHIAVAAEAQVLRAEVPSHEVTAAEEGEEQEPGSQAKVNARRRRVTWEWLQSRPWWRLLAIRQLTRPVSRLLHTYIGRAGESWQRKEHAAMIKHNPEAEPARSRRSPLIEYVSLKAEKACVQQLLEIMTSDSWRWVPQTAWTLQCQALPFRLASRQGCLVHELLVLPTTCYPFKLFNPLILPDFDATILNEPACMLGPFSTKFSQQFPEDQLRSETSLTCLNFLAHLASAETIGIEHGHG